MKQNRKKQRLNQAPMQIELSSVLLFLVIYLSSVLFKTFFPFVIT